MPTKTTVTKAMLLAALRDIAETCKGDPEAGHLFADAALMTYIDDEEIKAAYEAVERWHA